MGRDGLAGLAAWWCLLAIFPPMYVSSATMVPADAGERFALHRLADALGHEPCGLCGDFVLALDLAGGDAVLVGAHLVDDEQPRTERTFVPWKIVPTRAVNCLRQVAAEPRPTSGGFGAGLAGHAVGRVQERDPVRCPAMRAHRRATPAGFLNKEVGVRLALDLRQPEAWRTAWRTLSQVRVRVSGHTSPTEVTRCTYNNSIFPPKKVPLPHCLWSNTVAIRTRSLHRRRTSGEPRRSNAARQSMSSRSRTAWTHHHRAGGASPRSEQKEP